MSGVAELHFDLATLEAGLDVVRESPRDVGTLAMICRRPANFEREVIEDGLLDLDWGLVGDNWLTRGSKATEDGTAHPDLQVTVMNVRAADLIAGGSEERRRLMGDQLFVDLLLSEENLPPGTRLQVGEALLERTAEPHRGCGKFVKRFGVDAQKFVLSPTGRDLNLRGINARVIEGGRVRRGDTVTVLR